MPPHKPSVSDPISALLDSADVMMKLAADLFCRPYQWQHDWLKVTEEFAPR